MRALKIGWLLAILVLVPKLVRAEYEIRVDFSKKALFFVELTDSSEAVVKIYPVALPEITPRNLPITGRVVEIIKNPYWYPTENTRRDYFKEYGVELPLVVPPGQPLNAMSKVKMVIVFDSQGINPVVRIHGTNTPSSIGRRVTRGCIRMLNKDILELTALIEAGGGLNSGEIKVIFEYGDR